jgi:3-hydroxyisobutyrate dehydrogenase-like beta-hydroxyacid dehydrogenase
MRVAYIGLGNMGRPMVENILKAGQELTVWNRTRANMEPLITSGVRGASLAREVAQEADVIDLPDVVRSAVSRSLASVLARSADNQGFLYGCQDRLREVRVKLRSGSQCRTMSEPR